MHYKIIRWKNYGFINPKPEGVLAITLEKKLQYVRQGSEWMPNPLWAIVRLYSVKKGMFAWGLLKDVEAILKTTGHTFEIKGLIKTAFRGMPSHALRPYQNDAVKAIFEHGGGVVCLPTGSGKTLLMIDYLRIMNVKSLVVVPTLDIKAQWEKHGLKNLTASTYQNPKLKDEMEQYDIVVFDECHHVAAKSLYTLATKVRTNTIVCGCCLDGETRVNTPKGKRKLKYVRVGQAVETFNCNTKRVEHKKVKRVFRAKKQAVIIKITTPCGDRKIVCSDEHSFYTRGKFIQAKHLNSGTAVLYLGDVNAHN